LPDIRAVHLHPKDIGAAIVSLDQATPPASWRWAGPDWQRGASNDAKITTATISARDPAEMARRWSEVLGLGAPQKTAAGRTLPIDDGALNFISSDHELERIVGFEIQTPSMTDHAVVAGTTFLIRSPQ
jgi:hypothetical protein